MEYNYYPNNANSDSIYNSMEYSYSNNSNSKIIIEDIEHYINEFLNSYNLSCHIINYYEIGLGENESKNKYYNFTFIELSPASKNIIMNNFNLNLTKDKIYILIIEDIVKDKNSANSAIRNIDYKFFLQNGTLLNLDIITEDIYADIYFPLIDDDLAKYSYSLYFSEQGYDIYDKNSNFYNDKCSSAHLDDNDITLSDRKKDIYPNNVTLCPDNCEYKAFNVEEKIINCDCNLNINKNYTNETDDFLKGENGNFFSYFLDNINYGIFKCFNLIVSYENLKKNYAFYSSFFISGIVIVMTIYFWGYGISKIRKIMNKEIPNYEKLHNDYVREMNKINKTKRDNRKSNNILLAPPKKKFIRKKNKVKGKTDIYEAKKDFIKKRNKKKSKNFKPFIPLNIDLIDSSNYKINKMSTRRNKTDIMNIPEAKIENINELPYFQAIKADKRNFFAIFLSVILKKIELIDLIVGKHKIIILLIFQYILSLLIDLFLNAFLYTDEVVSNKYHNNGQLDIIVSLTITLLSNIINSIICSVLNFSKGVEERLEQIMEIKDQFHYLYAFNKFIKIVKIKVVLYFLMEIFIIIFSFYYIIIFCIIYRKSQISLLINYLMSIVETLVLSIFVSIVVAITRTIGLKYAHKTFYNTSKYFDNNY